MKNLKSLVFNQHFLKVIFALLFSCVGMNQLKAQVVMEDTIYSNNEPVATDSLGTRILWGCAYDYIFLLEINSTANCINGVMTYVLPPGLEFTNVTSGAIANLTNVNNTLTGTVVGTYAYIKMRIHNTCDIPPGTSVYQSQMSYQSQNCAFQGLGNTFQILTPAAYLTSATYSEGTPAAGPVQKLAKINDDHFVTRTFHIVIAEGRLRSTDLLINDEYEIMRVPSANSSIILNRPNGPNPQNFTGTNPLVDITTAHINSWFGRDFLQKGDTIRVEEIFYVDTCTGLLVEDSRFTFRIMCTDIPGFVNEYLCKDVVRDYAVTVKPTLSNITFSHTIVPPLDVCGVDPSEITFGFSNPTFASNNTEFTGVKKMDSLYFSIDLEAFNFSISNPIDLAKIFIRHNSIDVPITTILAFAPNCIAYNPTTNRFTLRFNQFTDPSILGLWGGSVLFNNWYDPNVYNDFMELRQFRVVFKDMRYDYDLAYAYQPTQNMLLSQCGHPWDYYLFGRGSNAAGVYFKRMCGVEYNVQSQNFSGSSFLNYRNKSVMSTIAEANPVDIVSGGGPIDVDFTFGLQPGSVGSPWNYSYAGVTGNFFSCPDLSYQAEIIIPDIMFIPGTTIDFYPNPADPYTFISLPISGPVVNTIDNTNTYTVNLVGLDGITPIPSAIGMISAQVELIPCDDAQFGLANINCRIKSYCDSNCLENFNLMACFGTVVHWRCDGPCCGPPQGTEDFSFNRNSFGFTDNTLQTSITVDPAVHKLNRAYACDKIDVESDGIISALGEICCYDSNGFAVSPADTVGLGYPIICSPIPAMDSLYYQIKYTSPVSFQFFEIDTAWLNTTINGSFDIPNMIVDASSAPTYRLLFPIANQALSQQLQVNGDDINFGALLKVKEYLPISGPLYQPYYQFPQIRGQFVSITAGGAVVLSCDDWGDNLTILNVQTHSTSDIFPDGYANNEDYGWPSPETICRRRYGIQSYVDGGLPGLDEFPLEFRPILMWPDDSDTIELTIPANFYFEMEGPSYAQFRAKDRTGWLNVATLLSNSDKTISFINSGIPAQPWPIFEHDGDVIDFAIRGELRNDCPTLVPSIDNGSSILPLISRGYAEDPACIGDTVIINNPIVIEGSLYDISLESGNSTFYVDNQVGMIDGFGIEFNDTLPSASTNIQNAWIINLSDSEITIDSILINGNMVVLTNGMYQLGTLNHAQYYPLQIYYTLLTCSPGVELPVYLQYGFSCMGYPPSLPAPTAPVDYACGVAIDSFVIVPFESGLSVGPVFAPIVSSPCSPMEFNFNYDSYLLGGVNNIVLTASDVPSNFTYLGGSYILNGNTQPMPSPNITGTTYTWDVSLAAFSNESMLLADVLSVSLEFTGSCSMWDTEQTIDFVSTATDLCNNPITVNNGVNTLVVTIPAFDPLANTCTDCLTCDSLDMDIQEIENCSYAFTVIAPATTNCAVSITTWDFGDGNVASGPTATHQYTTPGLKQVCYEYTCLDSSGDTILTCTICDTVYVNCITCDSLGITATISPTCIYGCAYDFVANIPTDLNCAYDSIFWNFGDGNYATGNSVYHLYDEFGPQNVCYYYLCLDSLGDTILECSVCETIFVACLNCDSLSMQYVNPTGQCSFSFDAVIPANIACPNGVVNWNFGDGNTATGFNVNHTFGSSGAFNVCYEYVCMDSNGDTLAYCVNCEVVNANCIDCNSLGILAEITEGCTDGCMYNFTPDIPAGLNCAYDSIFWNFGDGYYSSQMSVDHSFTDYGWHQICYYYICQDSQGNTLLECNVCDSIFISCMPCDSLALNAKANPNCGYSFNVVNPFNTACDTEMVNWDFGDGTVAINAGTGIGHSYTSSGWFQVCYDYVCLDVDQDILMSCTVCDSIYVDCMSCDTLDLTIHQNSNCSYTFNAVNPFGSLCALEYVDWTLGDGTTGFGTSVTHTYTTTGWMQICYHYICYDGAQDTLLDCIVCDSIYVDCGGCETLTLGIKEIDKCVYGFEAVNPNNSLCVLEMVDWDFGDGSSGVGVNTTHTYTTTGWMNICYTYVCYDGMQNILYNCVVCDSIYVDCGTSSDPFCIRIPEDYHSDMGEQIITTSDGGYAVAGTIYKNGAINDPDMYMVKYKPDFTPEFYKRLGLQNGHLRQEFGYSVVELKDGYYVAGNVKVGPKDDDIFLVKLDLTGTFVWGFRYGSANKRIDNCRRMIDMQTTPEALLLVGFTNLLNEGDMDVLALRIDPSSGALTNARTYSVSDKTNDLAYDVVKVKQDQYVIVGEVSKTDYQDILAIGISGNLSMYAGQIITSSSTSLEYANGVTTSADRVYLTGKIQTPEKGGNIFVMEISPNNCLELNNRVYSHQQTSLSEEGFKIKADKEGNLIISGKIDDAVPSSGPDGLILKVDPSDLSQVWQDAKTTGIHPITEQYKDIIPYDSDYYLATGNFGDNATEQDIFITKLTFKGESCCLIDYPMKDVSMPFSEKSFNKEVYPLMEVKEYGKEEPYYDEKDVCKEYYSAVKAPESSFGDMPNDAPVFVVVPNPNNGNFEIMLLETEEGLRKVEILDVTGKLVYSEMIAADGLKTLEIRLDNLAHGMYTVKIETEESSASSRIVIR